MRIINNISDTLFQEVEIGSVFQWTDAIFMRTDNNVSPFGTMNAVNLESGLTVHFSPDNKVFLLPKAHVVLE